MKIVIHGIYWDENENMVKTMCGIILVHHGFECTYYNKHSHTIITARPTLKGKINCKNCIKTNRYKGD